MEEIRVGERSGGGVERKKREQKERGGERERAETYIDHCE